MEDLCPACVMRPQNDSGFCSVCESVEAQQSYIGGQDDKLTEEKEATRRRLWGHRQEREVRYA